MLHLATGQQPYKDLSLVQMVTAMTKGRALLCLTPCLSGCSTF